MSMVCQGSLRAMQISKGIQASRHRSWCEVKMILLFSLFLSSICKCLLLPPNMERRAASPRKSVHSIIREIGF